MNMKTDYERNLFETRYKKNDNEKTWGDVFKRVSNYVGNNNLSRETYFNLMNTGEFIPSSPQLWNYGTSEKSGSSCFTGRIEDSLDGIWEADETAKSVSKSSGGIGFDLSPIRPRGSKIGYSVLPSVGVIAVAQRLEMTIGYITAGGRARGALMLQLDIEHPDAMEFIFAKRPVKNMIENPITNEMDEHFTLPLQNCNMSLRLSDKFLRGIENNENWTFSWKYKNGEVFEINTWETLIKNMMPDPKDFKNVEYQRFFKFSFYPYVKDLSGPITCRQVWDFIIDNAWNHADPGIVFSDLYEKFNPTDKYGKLLSNPCSEYIAIPGGSCLLGSINMRQMFNKETNSLDYSKLERITKQAINFLNDSINKTSAPVKYINDITNKIRTIGLGIMGLGDLLFMLGIKYGSKESIILTERIMATITSVAWEESFDLCMEKKYPKCEYWQSDKMATIFTEYANAIEKNDAELAKRFLKLSKRTKKGDEATNTTVTSIAPTGSISQIAGFVTNISEISGGIEPIYSSEIFRQDNSGKKTTLHDLTASWIEQNSSSGLPDYFVYAVDKDVRRTVSSEEHIYIQGAAARFTSMSVSKTINLPNDCTKSDIGRAYIMAWKEGIKGTACYRDGSKPFQVLSNFASNVKKESAVVADAGKRTEWLPGWIRKIKVDLGTGKPENAYVIIGMKDNVPYETFIHSDQLRKLEPKIIEGVDGCTRMTSLALRHGIPLEYICQQLERINGQHIFSLPIKISQSLARFLSKEVAVKEPCPSCNSNDGLIREEGCIKCKYCQYSKCG